MRGLFKLSNYDLLLELHSGNLPPTPSVINRDVFTWGMKLDFGWVPTQQKLWDLNHC